MTNVKQLVECPGCGGLIDLDELVIDMATLRIVLATPVQLEWEPTGDGWLRPTCAMIQLLSEDVPRESRLVVHECKHDGPGGGDVPAWPEVPLPTLTRSAEVEVGDSA